MIFGVRRLEPKEWGELTAKAHLVAFGENRDPELERIDFALLATSLCDDAFGYVTCIEMDKETLYWQRGGSFPNAKGTVLSLQGTRALASYCGQFYKRITARVESLIWNIGVVGAVRSIIESENGRIAVESEGSRAGHFHQG